MNILEQFQKAKKERDARLAETKWGVVTLGEIVVGSVFEFGTTDQLRVGDVVPICAHRRFEPFYGSAAITKDLGRGFYEAKRTR